MNANNKSGFEIAAYYFPNYHVDARNVEAHGPDWTEWQLVKHAVPRFAGHAQPKVPAWGYTDEADPAQMASKIAAAADHGLTAFIFDWYWYDGPFLQRALDEGFLGAANNRRLKFALMWANHDWNAIQPASVLDLKHGPRLQYPGQVNEQTFSTIIDHVIEYYFRHPSHWQIDGCPYFSIYELGMFVKSAGSRAAARRWLDEFRARTRRAGFAGLHLNAVVWSHPNLPGESTPADPADLVRDLGFDSTTSYVWVHYGFPRPGQTQDYVEHRDWYFRFWNEWRQKSSLPYFPNVSMGWDPSPRVCNTDTWPAFECYPCTPIVTGNSPARFRQALQMTRERIEREGLPRRITINSWNEWTEGSYLEPDIVNGLAYLEAIREAMR